MEASLASGYTRRFDIPLTHLEFDYVKNCSNVKELEKILKVLRSNEEGYFPDLERCCEGRLIELNPSSRALRKDKPVATKGDLDSTERDQLDDDIKSWTSDMKYFEGEIKTPNQIDEDTELPPIRSGTNITLTADGAQTTSTTKTNKRVMPREYRDWDKIDIDKELEKVDGQGDNKVQEKTVVGNKEVTNIPELGDISGMSEAEKLLKANREKDKGNEAFRAGDYKEAISYYSRSIALQPTEASYNNRALAYLKHEDWHRALTDTNTVIKMDKNNVKALLRRGSAYKGLKQYLKAKTDLSSVLELEPKNKKAQDLIKDIDKIMEKEKEEKKTKGKRMVIEDVDGSDDDTEQIVNGNEAPDTPEPAVEKKQSRRIQIEEVESEDEEEEDESNTPLVNGHASSKDKEMENSLSDRLSDNSQGTSGLEKEVSKVNEQNIGTKTNESKQKSQSKISKSEFEQDTSSKTEQSDYKSTDTDTKEQVNTKSDNKKPVIDNTKDVSVTSDADNTTVSDEASSIEAVPSDDVSSEAHMFQRPVFYKLDFPDNCVSVREEATKCFKNGQYGEGCIGYTKLINILEKVPDQVVNLSLSYSNRAACHLKTGDLPGAIKDCTKSLELIPHSFKPLLRRAMAYEHLERFDKAYIDYRHVLLIEGSEQQAHLGTKRCQEVLTKKHGAKWREKVKLEQVSQWEIPIIRPIADKDKPLIETTSTTLAAKPQMAVKDTPLAAKPPTTVTETSLAAKPKPTVKEIAKEEKVLSPREKFEKVKGQGNDYVKQGKFREAVQCYTECCEILPDEMVPYTNRALCYIRLNQAEKAESDCTRVLGAEKDNVKALFRRAQARKMLHNYSDGIKDLKHLLDVDPKNSAAKKEMDLLKNYWREQLQNMKKDMPAKSEGKAATEKTSKSTEKIKLSESVKPENKSRKRMVIEEVESEDETPPTKGKDAESKKKEEKSKSKQKTKIEELKTQKVKEVKSDSIKKESKPPTKTDTKSGKPSKSAAKKNAIIETSSGLPRVPKSVPKLEKATPYEFISAWNSLKKSETVQPYYELLKQISPADLTTVISNKLDGTMLNTIVRCVSEHFIKDDDMDTGYQLMHNLSQVPRFGTVSMFMSSKDKSDVTEVLGKFVDHKSSLYTPADVNKLKQAYSVG